jgi:hypothetical protein
MNILKLLEFDSFGFGADIENKKLFCENITIYVGINAVGPYQDLFELCVISHDWLDSKIKNDDDYIGLNNTLILKSYDKNIAMKHANNILYECDKPGGIKSWHKLAYYLQSRECTYKTITSGDAEIAK